MGSWPEMVYAMGCRGSTKGGRDCVPSGAVQLGGTVVRIMDAGDYLPKTWLRPALKGRRLKGPMEPALHVTWLACR